MHFLAKEAADVMFVQGFESPTFLSLVNLVNLLICKTLVFYAKDDVYPSFLMFLLVLENGASRTTSKINTTPVMLGFVRLAGPGARRK